MTGKRLISCKAWLGRFLRRLLRVPAEYLVRPQLREGCLLEAYRGLVHQAYLSPSFQPQLSDQVFWKGQWRPWQGLPPTKSPAARERDNAVHHYGHDVVLKRYASLPLVAHPLPFLLEHGVNFSDESTFEKPEDWVRTYLCMGPRRASLLQHHDGVLGKAIGPYIRYAQPPVDQERLAALRRQLGRVLLLIPPHSTAQLNRSWSDRDWVDLVESHRRCCGYQHVIWMGFWKDPFPSHPIPKDWIFASNGHASNPWFLDCQRLLFELSEAVCCFSMGTHVGYALELNKPLLMFRQPVSQKVVDDDARWGRQYSAEAWDRQRLFESLLRGAEDGALHPVDFSDARQLLDPWFGFSVMIESGQMRSLLRGRRRF